MSDWHPTAQIARAFARHDEDSDVFLLGSGFLLTTHVHPLIIKNRKRKIFKIFLNRIMFEPAIDLTLDRRKLIPLFQRVIREQKNTYSQYWYLLLW